MKPKKLTIVLDLDGTLIRASSHKPNGGPKPIKVKFKPVGQKARTVWVQKRPFLSEFLLLLCKEANIGIFFS